ncbi:hypothetical protein G6F58_013766 [Rhizopus delemar]|nr:hypothetical protein G6F58_013766 [Rhizopus delemar]
MTGKPLRRVLLVLCRSRHELRIVCRERRRYRVEIAARGLLEHKPLRAAAKSLRLSVALAIVQIDCTSPNALAGFIAVVIALTALYALDAGVRALGWQFGG